ncbi:MAG: DUF4864 domain-containing protein [Pseudomonadota bacterium]
MTQLFRALVLVLIALMPLRAMADEPADTIQGVISDQLAAFQANDVETAFGFASPTIQEKFGDPANFGRMVELAYPMVWRPRRFEMRQLVDTDFGPVQVVLFEDGSGRLHEAGYLMQQVDGVWRINGVRLREVPQVGA